MQERKLVLMGVASVHGEVEARTWAQRVAIVLLAGLVAALTLLATTGTASATCYSSTPASSSFSDLTGDTTGPDVLHVDVTLDAGCAITIDPVLGSGLTGDDVVFTYINTDGNTATGNPGYGGADKVVVVAGAVLGTPPVLYSCPATCDFSQGEILQLVGDAGFSTDLNQLGVPSPTTLGIRALAVRTVPSLVFDNAPEAIDPAYAFALSFATSPPVSPPPPPPPPPPASPPPPPPAAQTQKVSKGCTVPNIKGKSVAKAKKALAKAGCKYKIKGKGKVASTKPKAGTQTSDTVQVKAKKKRKRH
jgi:hypothetical protein